MAKPGEEQLLHAPTIPGLSEADIALRIGYAVAAGLIVALLYWFTLGRRKSDGLAMPVTLLLLSLLVCMVTLIVNGNLTLAFTLGGTLAIIRFRTIVDDTRDTAFVIASVVVGMGIGTGAGQIVLIGLPVFAALVLAATFIVPHGPAPGHKIVVRLANDRDPDAATTPAFAACGIEPTLLAIDTAKQGAAIEAIYSVKKLDSPSILKLLATLRVVEGVQGVEVKPM
jgi:hypothetical protein